MIENKIAKRILARLSSLAEIWKSKKDIIQKKKNIEKKRTFKKCKKSVQCCTPF